MAAPGLALCAGGQLWEGMGGRGARLLPSASSQTTSENEADSQGLMRRPWATLCAGCFHGSNPSEGPICDLAVGCWEQANVC